jgi:hypothetical protein
MAGEPQVPHANQNAHALEPEQRAESPMQRSAPGERDGSTHSEHDVVNLHVGNPCRFLSGTGQQRGNGLRAANKETTGCSDAFHRLCVLLVTAYACRSDMLG